MKIFFEVNLELFTVFNDLDNPKDFYVHRINDSMSRKGLISKYGTINNIPENSKVEAFKINRTGELNSHGEEIFKLIEDAKSILFPIKKIGYVKINIRSLS